MSIFRPLPLLGNPHVQTILGTLLGGLQRSTQSTLHMVALPDGDRIALHETPPSIPLDREPIALLVHGLGGSHSSPYMARMTSRLAGRGWRVFRMDLRGAGAGIRLARRFYNAACSDDLHVVVDHLAQAYPQSPLAVVGFSLGGNIVLKYLGEFADRLPPTFVAGAAMSPPIDLLRCSELIAKFPFYDAHYIRYLTAQVALHERHFPDVPKVTFPAKLTLRQFDELYTAPRWHYADALDYYRKASSLPWIEAIRVPTFVLTARDDPFIAVQSFDELTPPPTVELQIAAHGGHLGFLGPDGAGGIRWAETRLVEWLTARIIQ